MNKRTVKPVKARRIVTKSRVRRPKFNKLAVKPGSRCNCNFDEGHAPSCDIVKAHDALNKAVLEPKVVKKQWKKSSRYRAALKRAKGHNHTRLYRLGRGGNPFLVSTIERFNEILWEESCNFWNRQAKHEYDRLQQPSPWRALLADQFPEGMGDCISPTHLGKMKQIIKWVRKFFVAIV